MHINWSGKKCVLCLKEAPLSKEHIIPHALGGILTCSFLCGKCNSTLGSSLESKAKADPSIRFAVENLQSQIPDELTQRLKEGLKFVSDGSGGIERGKLREGEFRVKSRMKKDGSLIQPTCYARKSIKTILLKSGASEDRLTEALRKFDEAQENQKTKVAPGLEVVKWQTGRIKLDLKNSKLMSPLVPLKIAYEFLACHLGIAIYDAAPQVQELLTALVEMLEDDSCYEVERLKASEYRPFHGICFEENSPYSCVLIRLFGWIAFRVHFRRLAVRGSRFIYTQYLDTNREDLQILT